MILIRFAISLFALALFALAFSLNTAQSEQKDHPATVAAVSQR
jgi:hypothetical protein